MANVFDIDDDDRDLNLISDLKPTIIITADGITI